jgi:hypothetical protein
MRSGHIRFAAALCSVWLVSYHLGLAKELAPSVSSATGVIFVYATVEGRPATFLLDTGAERSSLNATFAARLGFSGQV